MRTIVVEDYNPEWPHHFEDLRQLLMPSFQGLPVSIEHVGSTSVPGLAAKPIIDIDIVVPDAAVSRQVIAGLAPLGYWHQGDLGIPGRAAMKAGNERVPFSDDDRTKPPHHLYVILETSAAWENHRRLRSYLRSHPEAVMAYAALKKQLAAAYPHDIDAYVASKTPLLADLLTKAGLAPHMVAAIRRANETPGGC